VVRPATNTIDSLRGEICQTTRSLGSDRSGIRR